MIASFISTGANPCPKEALVDFWVTSLEQTSCFIGRVHPLVRRSSTVLFVSILGRLELAVYSKLDIHTVFPTNKDPSFGTEPEREPEPGSQYVRLGKNAVDQWSSREIHRPDSVISTIWTSRLTSPTRPPSMHGTRGWINSENNVTRTADAISSLRQSEHGRICG